MVVQRYDKVGRLVSKDYGPKRTKSKQALSSRIRKCDDDTVKSMILDYFLDYNKVDSIYENLNLRGTFYSIVLDSPLGKRLRFKTNPSDELVKKIYDKYRFDRDEFLINLDGYYNFEFSTTLEHSNYEVEGTVKSYSSESEEDKTRKVLFCLAASHDEDFVPRVREDEVEFFGRAISLIMGDEIAEIEEVKTTNSLGFLKKEYLIVDKVEKDDKEYYYIAQVNEDETDIEDNYKIVCATYKDGEIYLDEVLGEDKLKSILPMFVKD